jgi:hypothetical protein
MLPSTDIIPLLRDEAYLTLCRKSHDKAPDGGAPRKEVPLKDRLARIDVLEDRLKSTLHAKLCDYLREASYDYRYSTQVISAINAWEQGVNPYGDCLLTFAYELRNAARTLGGPKENLYTLFNPRAKAMSVLHLAAEGLDRASLRLDAAANHLNHGIARTIYEKVRVAPPPFAGMAQWMERLALLPNVEALVAMQAREMEVRPLIANKLLLLHSSATTARETVADVQRDYCENYWDDLRRYALANYVKDREVNEVLDDLTSRYSSTNQQDRPDETAVLYA